MSQEYKDKINKLVDKANKGNTEAAQELLDEASKWSQRIKELKQDEDENKAK